LKKERVDGVGIVRGWIWDNRGVMEALSDVEEASLALMKADRERQRGSV